VLELDETMITFDLKCAKGHVFEAWFASSQGFERDAKAGRVECPMCGSTKVEKAPMAPNIAAGRGGEAREAPVAPDPRAARQAEAFRMMRELQSRIERDFDHVGDRFAEEARKIHYGEVEKRGIYGSATPEESDGLKDEGIEFGQIPWLPRHDA
jgi:hypothetical protein